MEAIKIRAKKGEVLRELWGQELLELLRQVGLKVNNERLTYEKIQEIIKQKYDREFSIRELRYYREKYITNPEKLPSEIQKKFNEEIKKFVDTIEKRRILMKETEKRLNRLIQLEEQFTAPLQQTHDNMELLDRLYNSYDKALMERGIIKKEPDRFEIKAETEITQRFQLALESAKKYKKIKEERLKIVQQKIIERIKKNLKFETCKINPYNVSCWILAEKEREELSDEFLDACIDEHQRIEHLRFLKNGVYSIKPANTSSVANSEKVESVSQ